MESPILSADPEGVPKTSVVEDHWGKDTSPVGGLHSGHKSQVSNSDRRPSKNVTPLQSMSDNDKIKCNTVFVYCMVV